VGGQNHVCLRLKKKANLKQPYILKMEFGVSKLWLRLDEGEIKDEKETLTINLNHLQWHFEDQEKRVMMGETNPSMKMKPMIIPNSATHIVEEHLTEFTQLFMGKSKEDKHS